MDIAAYVINRQQRMESFLERILPKDQHTLYQAMRYTVLDGGKRFRPLLAYATGESFKADLDALDAIAAAVELIHCYSLIHDDLPAMDDDDLRRGKPSCHKAFNEATAILAGDALQSLAFEILSDRHLNIDSDMQLHIIDHLAKASSQMALGQALDMHPEEIANIESLENIHLHKTGALIEAGVLMGAHAGGCKDRKTLSTLSSFAKNLGLAYQIQDDVLDLEATTEVIGKPSQSDLRNEKHTYPILLGIESAREEAKTTYNNALIELSHINIDLSLLENLVKHMIQQRDC